MALAAKLGMRGDIYDFHLPGRRVQGHEARKFPPTPDAERQKRRVAKNARVLIRAPGLAETKLFQGRQSGYIRPGQRGDVMCFHYLRTVRELGNDSLLR